MPWDEPPKYSVNVNDACLHALRRDNAGREPVRLALKLSRMAHDPFTFFRGSCAHFYRQLPEGALFRDAPRVWACGDLHLENLGSYKGDNHQVYFDINDFDEALLAPANWDLVRVLCSVFVAKDVLGLDPLRARVLCALLLQSYTKALSLGTARWIERETAKPPVQDLLIRVRTRDARSLLDARTTGRGRARRIRIDGKKALAASPAQIERVTKGLLARGPLLGDLGPCEVLDVARRIAGTGSLGLERYVVLMRSTAKRSDGRAHLLDLKASYAPCALHADALATLQPPWAHAAERIARVQQRMQAIPMAWLEPLVIGAQPFVLKRLLPSEDRIALASLATKPAQLELLLQNVGQCLAWAQLRSSGRGGADMADALIAYGRRSAAHKPLLVLAERAAGQVLRDYAVFAAAHRAGAF
jgi:uncharacterized protein (DUF2252 family)